MLSTWTSLRIGTLRHRTVQYSIVQYVTAPYSTVLYSALHYTTLHCSTVQYVAISLILSYPPSTFHLTVTLPSPLPLPLPLSHVLHSRLYISSKNDQSRRSCQTVLQIMVEQLRWETLASFKLLSSFLLSIYFFILWKFSSYSISLVCPFVYILSTRFTHFLFHPHFYSSLLRFLIISFPSPFFFSSFLLFFFFSRFHLSTFLISPLLSSLCSTLLFSLFLHHILLYSVMMAPIVPHMAEDAWQNLPYTEKPTKFSVFDKGWITESGRFPSFEAKKWDRVRALRGDVNGCIG